MSPSENPEWFSEEVAVWGAINEYAAACGGDTGNATISDRRMNAVAAVGDAIEAAIEKRFARAACPCSFPHPPHDSCDGRPQAERRADAALAAHSAAASPLSVPAHLVGEPSAANYASAVAAMPRRDRAADAEPSLCPCCGHLYGCYCHEHPHDKPECPGRDGWTAEMQLALDFIPREFCQNDAWENGVKRMADEIARLRAAAHPAPAADDADRAVTADGMAAIGGRLCNPAGFKGSKTTWFCEFVLVDNADDCHWLRIHSPTSDGWCAAEVYNTDKLADKTEGVGLIATEVRTVGHVRQLLAALGIALPAPPAAGPAKG